MPSEPASARWRPTPPARREAASTVSTESERALLHRLAAESEIRETLYRYCRGIDRRQYDLVRSCYHPDAIDSHGMIEAGVEEFLQFVETAAARLERSMHFIGNIMIELDGDTARSESYVIATHRGRPKPDDPDSAQDHTLGVRYIDDWERRDGQFRISHRRCVFEWSKTSAVGSAEAFPSAYLRGQPDGSDPVFTRR